MWSWGLRTDRAACIANLFLIIIIVLFSAAVAVSRFFKGGKLFRKHEWISFSLLAGLSLDKFSEKSSVRHFTKLVNNPWIKST